MNYDGLRAPGEIQAAGKPAESCYATMYYDGRFKLSVYHGIQFGELYDMENDPQEQHNPGFFRSFHKIFAPGADQAGPLLTPHLRQNKRAEVNNGDRILYQATIRC